MSEFFGHSGLQAYAWPALVTMLILIQYIVFTMLCGIARGKSNLKAPDCSGDESFQRVFRVQQNTLEQLIVTLPALWLCALFFGAMVAAVGGAVFFVGRLMYRAGYISDPDKRAPGMIIGMLANVVMLGCAIWGVISMML